MSTLPIEQALPALKDALRAGPSAVLVAAPGAGKTTRVPLALLDEPWLDGRRIVMLEPRRLAARAAARFMAASLGEQVGQTVGYRIRMDTRVGPETRIEVVTEGVLTRMLQSDPALEGVGLLIFDEFHERSLHADLGLALALEARAVLRPDLRILVMSATLDAEPVAGLLGADGHPAPIITSEGREHPVETRYLKRPVQGPIEPTVVRTILAALDAEEGDILVFLPGAPEIRRVQARLEEAGLRTGVRVAPLHGNLPQEAQDLAIGPSKPGERKVVLATSIAETSLTIEGIRVVIDSGLMRVPRFSPRTGMTRLETVPVSRASADQRRGRAGRLGPGVCYRLWTEEAHGALAPHGTPEILEADLASLALELAAWGVDDPAALRWLDLPPPAAFAQARELLTQLGALDERGAITAYGRRMAELSLHPRLAHLLLRGAELGLGELACELVALLGDRDIFRGGDVLPDVDLRLRVEALRGTTTHQPARAARGAAGLRHAGFSVDRAALNRARAEARYWKQRLQVADRAHSDSAPGGPGRAGPEQPLRSGDDIDSAGLLLAFAYPDRIAQRRAGEAGRFLLRNGRGAALPPGPQPLAGADYLVAADLDGQGRESRIFLAAPVELEELQRHFGNQIGVEESVAWDPEARAVRARRKTRLGALVLSDAPLPDPDPDAVLQALLQGIAREGIAALPWSKTARQLRDRLAFMHHLAASGAAPGPWPDVSDEALTRDLAAWLGPHLYGMRRWSDLERLDLTAVLEGILSWEQKRTLDTWAPTHFVVPSGSRIPIDYSDPAAPVLAVRLQELFGLPDTPRVACGQVPLTLHLLSPAHRPVQVTRDLASFWRTAYFEVRKDLRGRYPKHDWPDDPLHATPTRRARPRA